MLIPVRGHTPKLGANVFIAETARIIGDVQLGERVSVWYQAVVRGDVMPIIIGAESNIQDGVVVHGTYQKASTTIGRRVSVGHGALIHGCSIADHCLIGMRAIIMDGAEIGEESLVAAGSIVTEGAKFTAGSLIMGSPARVKRPLSDKEREQMRIGADRYLHYKTWYEDEEA